MHHLTMRLGLWFASGAGILILATTLSQVDLRNAIADRPETVEAECPVVDLPAAFTMRQVGVFATQFDITAAGRTHGKVREKTNLLTTYFDYENSQGKLIARGRKLDFPWGMRIEISDCNGRVLGSMQEKFLSVLIGSRSSSQYAIRDPQGNEVAVSDKVDYGNTRFTIKDRSTRLIIATITRPWLRLSDRWEVQRTSSPHADPRVLVMLAAFKTDSDRQR